VQRTLILLESGFHRPSTAGTACRENEVPETGGTLATTEMNEGCFREEAGVRSMTLYGAFDPKAPCSKLPDRSSRPFLTRPIQTRAAFNYAEKTHAA
jgi:hypothetical protein